MTDHLIKLFSKGDASSEEELEYLVGRLIQTLKKARSLKKGG